MLWCSMVQMSEKGTEIFGNPSSSSDHLGCAYGWRPCTDVGGVCVRLAFHTGEGFFGGIKP